MLHELIKKRYSPRAFSNEAVEEEKIISLLEAARWSPSSMNEQPWRFIVGVKGEGETYEKIYNALFEQNQSWAKNAPVLILAVVKEFNDISKQNNRHAEYDLGQAIAHLTIQATSLNLYLHQMGGFDPDKAGKLFNIPEGYTPMSVIAIGYLGNIDSLPEQLKVREKAKRNRKELSELVFDESFGHTSRLIENKNVSVN
ncbi:MAG: nitroreductase family protein [Ignavibacteriaceae bacterium]